MESDEIEVVDLHERLKVATKPFDPEPVRMEMELTAEEDPEEFEPDNDPEPFENEAQEDNQSEQDGPGAMRPEDLADLLLHGGNFVQTKVFRGLTKRKYLRKLSETERQRVEELAAQEDQPEPEYTPEDLALMERLKRMERAIEDIPLRPDEIEMLKRYLVKVSWLQNTRLSPEMAFVLAAGQVMLPRALTLMLD